MRKVVDNRVRQLIENGVTNHHRSMFVMIGDKGRDQVVNLHYMLSKSQSGKYRPKVLWAYKKDLGFSSHQRKRQRQIKREVQRGVRNEDTHDPFELFLTSTDIRFCYYKDSHKILGKTYQICVLQDFEALTPNLLARTIETVEGGGLVILLLRSMTSLKSLYTMAMDVHGRYRTESHDQVVPRFNERFILSLAQCQQCLVIDDELNVLPISSHCQSICPPSSGTKSSDLNPELIDIKASLSGVSPISELVSLCKTVDQAKSLMQLVNCVQEADGKSIISLTAGRGRGKSACLGLTIASAISYGLSNIFVCAPSSENLSTLFELVFKGFDALDYAEHVDYEIMRSKTTGDVIKINVHRDNRRQTIQFIQAKDGDKLLNCELLVVDEAAAIPLVMVKELMGSYLTIISSTINGYEGTGRSLSLKLFAGLRKSKQGSPFLELSLNQPIRYGDGDHVEQWLNRLLCLDCPVIPISSGAPHPSNCHLYYVNRDTLFSHHTQSEAFLHRLMSLFVSSHYKNSPNDLQMMSDAPAHHLYVLLGPSPSAMPDILAVVQVALEGGLRSHTVHSNSCRGQQPSGDLIPWTVSQQFQDPNFASLHGARVVRIATHPSLHRMGYGARVLDLLGRYYGGDINGISGGDPVSVGSGSAGSEAQSQQDLHTESITPRSGLLPILTPISDRSPEYVDYIGTSFGLSQSLYNFWSKGGYEPVYLRQTANDVTGENTIIMISPSSSSSSWAQQYISDFRQRFISLLPIAFPSMTVQLALSIISPSSSIINGATRSSSSPSSPSTPLSVHDLRSLLSPFDLRRLEAYSRSLVDYHLILDLIPSITRLLFLNRLSPSVSVSYSQAAIAVGLGLQYKQVDQLHEEMGLEPTQILALFNKLIRKVMNLFKTLEEESVKASLKESDVDPTTFQSMGVSLEDDLNEGSTSTHKLLAAKQQSLLEVSDLAQYAINQTDDQWASALPKSASAPPKTIAIPSTKKRKTNGKEQSDRSTKPNKHSGQSNNKSIKKKKSHPKSK